LGAIQKDGPRFWELWGVFASYKERYVLLWDIVFSMLNF
jgi:hypothetical protein